MIRSIKKRIDLIYCVIILFSSMIFVAPFFTNQGRPATFDALFHITNIAQYSMALKSGDFPVYWENGFANFGLPIGIVAHQVPSYLGAVINLVLNNPTISFNILVFLGIFLSALFFYFFLRLYFSPALAFVGAFLFNFAPYRILNVYIRGAEPEIFSNIFLPLILISIYQVLIKRKFNWFFLFVVFISLLALTHPMNLLIYSLIIGPYFLFCLWKSEVSLRQKVNDAIAFFIGGILSLGIASYYLFPLINEIKYFYIGLSNNQLAPNHFLGPVNFFMERWMYESSVDKFTRAQTLQTGIIESVIFLIGIIYTVYARVKKWKFELIHVAALMGLFIIFFTLSPSNVIYQIFPFLGNIQYPWRMLNGFIFIPPIIAAYLLAKKPNLIPAASIIIIIAVILLRFPQLYGKNFKYYPDSIYYFNRMNVHSDLMSTIWMQYSQDYPTKISQWGIIDGEGNVIPQVLKNSERVYKIQAKTDLRMIDYTFYFPNWTVYVDGKAVDINYMDGYGDVKLVGGYTGWGQVEANNDAQAKRIRPIYRGVITYNLSKGSHSVLIKFEDSKARFVGKIISAISVFILVFLILIRKRIYKFIT